jgi:hypothetical protein
MLGSLNNDGVQDPYYENGAVQLCGRDSTCAYGGCVRVGSNLSAPTTLAMPLGLSQTP